MQLVPVVSSQKHVVSYVVLCGCTRVFRGPRESRDRNCLLEGRTLLLTCGTTSVQGAAGAVVLCADVVMVNGHCRQNNSRQMFDVESKLAPYRLGNQVRSCRGENEPCILVILEVEGSDSYGIAVGLGATARGNLERHHHPHLGLVSGWDDIFHGADSRMTVRYHCLPG
ncbi:hypothetical protein L226DRAFT_125751 [Lentinus tigrinus ALCF2SS1-7]|uniref:uncharacterized protein n=1 Tax=Lentinus tigrinus ALCF2SS1-7 TaxID=1328758 RepID=UPI001165D6DE|nr:hypothetical protein L226DRAFT_125751 [Lentinus tigrinus ALCF2SS1-7]